MNQRRGFNLIEMTAVMSVGAVMMGVAVTLLYGLLRTEGSGREHVHRQSVLGRLADQFRRDVHAAQTVAAAADGEGRQFELAPGRTVTYRAQPGALTRSEQVDGKIERRESFALPPGSTATIQIPANTKAAIASLRIVPSAGPSGQPAHRIIQIDAVLAGDHRFTARDEP
jgi:prepilin-type N-terminal cleavage/methylation domain-containing protein